METIGLIAAMPQESEALLRCIKEWKHTALGSFRGARFRLMDRDCLVVTSGMGLQHAMDGTRALLAATSPHLLVSFGIAGAVNDDLRIGDVAVARNTCLLDMGLPGPFLPLASLSKEAWNAATQVLQSDGARLVAGTAITTRGSQVILERLEEMAHPVLEMETAGIAQVAAEMGIPLVEAVVHVHPFFQRDQAIGFDPPVQGGPSKGVIGKFVPCDLPEACDGEVGQVFKGR